MPRIVSTPQARPTSQRGAARARSKASEAMGKLLSRGVTATEDHSPQDRAQQRETLKEWKSFIEALYTDGLCDVQALESTATAPSATQPKPR